MTREKFRNVVDRIAKKLFENGLPQPDQYVEQMNLLFFLKMLEDNDNQQSRIAHLSGTKPKSFFATSELEKLRWSAWSQFNNEQMRDFLLNEAFKSLGQVEGHPEIRKYFTNVQFMILEPSVLREVVDMISAIDFAAMDTDAKGDAYEQLISHLSTAGRTGAFRTPRQIIRTIVKMVDPKVGERILDPACGTAGFLVEALQHIKAENSSKENLEDVTAENGDKLQHGVGDKISQENWQFLSDQAFWGWDISHMMARIAMMNLMLHGMNSSHIYRRDSLVGQPSEEETMKFDVILANPPFSGAVGGTVRGYIPQSGQTTDTTTLFINLMGEHLANGGRCGVIVNEGFLFGTNNANKEARKHLLEKFELEAVVSLPQGVFNPYAGVKTSFLAFKKTGNPTKKVWFYELLSDGYKLNAKRTPDPSKNMIPDLLANWPDKKETEHSWLIDAKKIADNNFILSANAYKPASEDGGLKYREPKEIQNDIQEVSKSLSEWINTKL